MTATPGILTRNATPRPMTTLAEPAPAPLDASLARLRLDGAIFFRAEFTEGWAYESPEAAAELADALRPGAERLGPRPDLEGADGPDRG